MEIGAQLVKITGSMIMHLQTGGARDTIHNMSTSQLGNSIITNPTTWRGQQMALIIPVQGTRKEVRVTQGVVVVIFMIGRVELSV